MATSIETMKSFMNVLKQYANDTVTSGIAILDNAVREVTRFGSLQEAINSFVNDVTDTSRIADTAQRLKETCGIVLGADNDFTADTGAVSGANAGNGTVKNAASIVPETGTLAELSMPAAGSVTSHSYTTSDGKTFSFNIQWPASFNQVQDRKWQTLDTYDPRAWTTEELTNQTFASNAVVNEGTVTYTAQQIRDSIEAITKGMEHWWVAESAKLAYDSYGLDFNGKTLKVNYFVNMADVQAATSPADKKENDTTPADVIEMGIGLPIYGDIDTVDVNGNTRFAGGANQCYLDRTIAHEMIHGTMQASGTLKGYDEKTSSVASMPEFFTEGVAELVMGLDDYDGQRTDQIVSLATDRAKLADAMVLASGTGTAVRYTSGYMFLRYLCQQNLGYQPDDTVVTTAVDTSANTAQNALYNIDAHGKSYAEQLILGTMSGQPLPDADAVYSSSSAAKVMDYGTAGSFSALELPGFRSSDSLSLVSWDSSRNPILASAQNG